MSCVGVQNRGRCSSTLLLTDSVKKTVRKRIAKSSSDQTKTPSSEMPLENLAFQAGKLVASESMEAGDDDRISGSEVLAQLRDLVESGQLHPELAEKVIQELTAEPESIGSSPDPEVVKKVVAQLGRKSAKSP